MSALASFRKRAKETRAYLKSLEDIERRLLGRRGKAFYRAAKAVAASRAAAYIMIYNAVEHAVREAIRTIRVDAKGNVQELSHLHLYWRKEILRARFGHKLSQGVNHEQLLVEVSEFFPGSVNWMTDEALIPFVGNIDHEKLFKFTNDIGAKKWKAPRGTLGGVDLVAIKNARNNLAHGEESFEEVGGRSTTADLIDQVDRVRDFVIAFLTVVDRYRCAKSYRIVAS